MLSMVEYVHKRIQTYEGETVIDFTMGNGHDTLFLAQNFSQVYAFDIQTEALKNTKKSLENYSNITYILDDHANFDHYVDTFDIGIFNLGYLPNYDHTIKTTIASTSIAIPKAIKKMTTALFIVVYIGHQEGKEESSWLLDYVKKLDSHEYNVSTYQMLNKTNSPYVIEIEKKHH